MPSARSRLGFSFTTTWARSGNEQLPCFVLEGPFHEGDTLVRQSRRSHACRRVATHHLSPNAEGLPGPTLQSMHSCEQLFRSAAHPMSSIPQCGYPIGVLKRRLLFQNSSHGTPMSLALPSPVTASLSPRPIPVDDQHPALIPTQHRLIQIPPVSPVTRSPSLRNVYKRSPRRIQRAYAR
jgi:hypothetical protein